MINQIFLKSNSYCFTVLEQFDEVSWSFFFGHIEVNQSFYNDAISLSIFNLDYKLISTVKNQITNDFLFPVLFSTDYFSFLDIVTVFLWIGFLIFSWVNAKEKLDHIFFFIARSLALQTLISAKSKGSRSIIFFFLKFYIICSYFFQLLWETFLLLFQTSLIRIVKKTNSFYNKEGYNVEGIFSAFLSFFIIQLDKKEVSIHLPQTKAKSGLGFIFSNVSYFFFFIVLQLLTTLFIFVWFDDLVYLYSATRGGSYVSIVEIFPQISFSFGIDEMFITFIGSLFIVGFESEEDLDILMLDEEEGEMLEEGLVIPLFISFFEKIIVSSDWSGSFAGLYMKISTIFGLTCFACLMGMVPYSDTSTSNFIFTFWLAVSIFISIFILMFRKKGVNHLFSLFMPSGCPLPLLLFLIPLEFISYIFRVVSLAVRIFANMMAGHILLKVIAVFAWSGYFFGDFGWLLKRYIPLAVLGGMILMESAIAIIQGYVFTLLTCLYVRDIFVSH